MYKKCILMGILLLALFGLNTSFAERGGMEHRDFGNRNEDFNRNDMNRNDLNRNDFNRGAAYGANRGAEYGAAYGAAAGSASSNSNAIPVNPNAAEQNMLYYSGVQKMEQQ